MIYESAHGNIRILLAGDIMPVRQLTPFDEPDFVALRDLIRDADVAFGNLETCVREPNEGVSNFTAGTPMTSPPALLQDLRWIGFDLLSCANNHITDYGVDGVLATLRHLQAANFPFAGAGANLAEARHPAYCDNQAGRVGLVAATSFFRPWNQAADQRPDAPGRPGINPLAFSQSFTVDTDAIAFLAKISDQLGLTQERVRHRARFYSSKEVPPDTGREINFLDAKFAAGSKFAVSTRVNREDAEANLRWIREARRQSDWVIFSFHSHEFGDAGRLDAETDVGRGDPAAFAVDFAHAAIDAGADIVAGHGPHLTLGIEIHKGKPIFYSLGNFIFQNDNVPTFPAEAYQRFGLDHHATPSDFLDARTDNETRGFPAAPEFWQSFVACCEFKDWTLAGVQLHPIDLGHGLSRSQRGRPVLARGLVAKAVLDRVQRLSERFGTRFEMNGDALTIRLA